MSTDTEFAVLADQTMIGWVKFNGEGELPDREMGLLYDNFVMPTRESLGDLDQSKWDIGLSNEPQDPWQHQVYLVLQNAGSDELDDAVRAVLALALTDVGREREAVSLAIGALAKHLPRYQRSMANYARLLVEPEPA